MKILVTAGPTREAIDPVRFISNRSTGKMGYAVAQAAADRGHEVLLVSGPVHLEPPPGVTRVAVESAAEMKAAVMASFPGQDALVMAAAVADWTPADVSPDKLKKSSMPPQISLRRTDDILQEIAAQPHDKMIVGFAAETGEVEQEARRKLRDKRLQLVVANDISRPGAGFGTDTNAVTLFDCEGGMCELPLQAKYDVAVHIVEWLENYKVRSG